MKRNKRILTVMLCVISAVVLSFQVYAKTTEEKISDAKKEADEQQQKLDEANESLNSLEDSKAQLEGSLAALNSKLETLSNEVTDLESELDEKQHADETEEDGRDTRERFGGKADEPHDAGIFRVFGDVHRRADAERKRRAHGDENEIERVADVGEDAGRSGEIARRRRKERPVQLRQTAL